MRRASGGRFGGGRPLAGQPAGGFLLLDSDALGRLRAVRRTFNDQLRTGADRGNLTV